MKILAIETSSDACSAALYLDGEIVSRFKIAPREHTSLLLPMMDEVLSEAGIALRQLDAVAVGKGPGAFTGVRIAISAAQGVAFSADLPVVPISSLAAIAYTASIEENAQRVVVAVDARMDEVYFGCYLVNEDTTECTQDEQVSRPDQLPVIDDESKWLAVGSGWKVYSQQMYTAFPSVVISDQDYFPMASAVAKLAVGFVDKDQVVSADALLPTYLRDKVVKD